MFAILIVWKDENQRKLARASKWQIFLYHRHMPALEYDMI